LRGVLASQGDLNLPTRVRFPCEIVFEYGVIGGAEKGVTTEVDLPNFLRSGPVAWLSRLERQPNKLKVPGSSPGVTKFQPLS
jgi:hypothetical protein